MLSITTPGEQLATMGVVAEVYIKQAIARARLRTACTRAGVRRGLFEDGASTIGESVFNMGT